MNTHEKLYLKWDDFSENLCSTFSEIQDDQNLVDVTLVCDDGKQIEAHKLVLIAGSLFFKNLLRTKINTATIIYMRGLKSQELLYLINFLYKGEVKIQQEYLSSFLVLAEELQVKGLLGIKGDNKKLEEECEVIKEELTTTNYNMNSKNVPNINTEPKENNGIISQIPEDYHSRPVANEDETLKQKMKELTQWNA